MKRTILTTVGTSLLTNPDRPWAPWRRPAAIPAAAAVDDWLRRADPVKASAETHTWHRLSLVEANDEDKVEVVLIHSQTEDGQFCAERLVTAAKTSGLLARQAQVDGLDYADSQRFNRGLRQLARVVGEQIKLGKALGTVELAATGGFKAEIAIANLVGALSETPVHYIYEQFTSLITIEPIPVALHADWIGGAGRSLLKAFASANDIIPIRAIESLLKHDERLLTLVDVDREHVALNLLGEMALRLLESPHEAWPPPTGTPPDDKVHLERDHHRPRGWEQFVATVASSRYVTSIFCEKSASGGRLRPAPDNESDLIHRLEGGPALNLRIVTTAKTSGQRKCVRNLLLKELKL